MKRSYEAPAMTAHERNKALYLAAIVGDASSVRTHLHAGANVCIDWLGNTALHWAACNGHADVVSLLTHTSNAIGCLMSVPNRLGRTPLHSLCMRQMPPHVQLDIARMLIACFDASFTNALNAPDLLGMTALHWAPERTRVSPLLIISKSIVLDIIDESNNIEIVIRVAGGDEGHTVTSLPPISEIAVAIHLAPSSSS